MAGVERRTLLYERDDRNSKKVFRLSDWNVVVTGIGTMLEPSQFVPLPAKGGQVDWEDDMTRLDIMENINFDSRGSANFATGGSLIPRSGR